MTFFENHIFIVQNWHHSCWCEHANMFHQSLSEPLGQRRRGWEYQMTSHRQLGDKNDTADITEDWETDRWCQTARGQKWHHTGGTTTTYRQLKDRQVTSHRQLGDRQVTSQTTKGQTGDITQTGNSKAVTKVASWTVPLIPVKYESKDEQLLIWGVTL